MMVELGAPPKGQVWLHSVDVQRKKGHAVVTGDPHRMKPHGLEEAVDELRGKGWYCDAEVVDDN